MNPRDKRDLPEIVAEILIEQHAMRQDLAGLSQKMSAVEGEIIGLRQETRESHTEMVGLFNNMTNAILDAMNRGTDRYTATNDRQDGTQKEIDLLKTRVTKLENPASDAA